MQSESLASELAQKLPAAALATLIGTLSVTSANVASAADYYTPPSGNNTTETVKQPQQSLEFPSGSTAVAPAVKGGDFQLPEGNQWRYSEFINAVQAGKVERVRFSKDGGQLQVGSISIHVYGKYVYSLLVNTYCISLYTDGQHWRSLSTQIVLSMCGFMCLVFFWLTD